ncbi:TetR/AcrR family transcriptional regulator [Nonomuraea diastatica]|nr:TetR family transcriptional regulator [Nonomuraea diastatica]
MTSLNIERRARLCDAAIEIVARAGLRGLTHRAVDAEAGVPPGTASRYFRTREALVRGVVERVRQVQFAKLRDLQLHLPDRTRLPEAVTRLAGEVLTVDRSQQLVLHELFIESTRQPCLGRLLTETVTALEELLIEVCHAAGITLSSRDALLLVTLCHGIVFTVLTTRPDAYDDLDGLVRTGVERIMAPYLHPAASAADAGGRR